MIKRYSSRTDKLSHEIWQKRIFHALSYDRIAGYFSSSVLEIAGEAIDTIKGRIRMVCNSSLSMEDVKTSTSAHNAVRKEWCESDPQYRLDPLSQRLDRLYQLIKSEKLQIKVLPDHCFGLIHGKAGVITLENGHKTSFLGSVNETQAGWELNYELLWEDDSPEAVAWVQAEFDALWTSAYAIPLPEFVVEDIQRISKRKVIYQVPEWRIHPEPAETIVEAPVNRKELGLWEHQKNFIHLAFQQHQCSHGSRLVLADMVGLGKTVQLAMAAKLMALWGEKPILIIVPKTLMIQWQDELKYLLDMPSAIWTGKTWVDENDIEYPCLEPSAGILRCPRRIGIISQGLIVANSESVKGLLSKEYECVIVDEAHRSRRRNTSKGRENERPEPNNLYSFLLELSQKTKSMLLATATPVQMNPIEAWDLLNILAQGSNHVMGTPFSLWRRKAFQGLQYTMGTMADSLSSYEKWDWLRDPFPPEEEDPQNMGRIRKALDMGIDDFTISADTYYRLEEWDRKKVERIAQDFFARHNPFIRYIVRRERSYLEETINPATEEPYLPKIEVLLEGDRPDQAIFLPTYLKQAYDLAVEFCGLLKKRIKSAGFMKTLLLRRMGSSIIAGRSTAWNLLEKWSETYPSMDEETEEDLTEDMPSFKDPSSMYPLTKEERSLLRSMVQILDEKQIPDPKLEEIKTILFKKNWIDRGCIIFSQYFDSANWVAESLSRDLSSEYIGLYAGGDNSGIWNNGSFMRKPREEIKAMIKSHEIRLLVGTDAASEGLNLQTLGSLINLDLPWNPTRLEQRKGRIQRIGQIYSEVWIYNMRYKESVEDRVHELLSARLENIRNLFGQIPDTLEDVWIDVALNNIEQAKQRINEIPKEHPFKIRYQKHLEPIDWESCSTVLDAQETYIYLKKGW